MRDCRTCWDRSRLECLLAQILVVVASTPSSEEWNTPLCAVEDWSGAGFHTKQPLNVGQPTVSQVVSSPNNQSCLDPSGLTRNRRRARTKEGACCRCCCCCLSVLWMSTLRSPKGEATGRPYSDPTVRRIVCDTPLRADTRNTTQHTAVLPLLCLGLVVVVPERVGNSGGNGKQESKCNILL